MFSLQRGQPLFSSWEGNRQTFVGSRPRHFWKSMFFIPLPARTSRVCAVGRSGWARSVSPFPGSFLLRMSVMDGAVVRILPLKSQANHPGLKARVCAVFFFGGSPKHLQFSWWASDKDWVELVRRLFLWKLSFVSIRCPPCGPLESVSPLRGPFLSRLSDRTTLSGQFFMAWWKSQTHEQEQGVKSGLSLQLLASFESKRRNWCFSSLCVLTQG